ncbi:MAG: hypothetical protein WBW81_14910 [Methylocella sp.]
MLKTLTANTLFYGDNLAILREHVEDESVDLVYLDPPFNSNANYNLLFKAPDGEGVTEIRLSAESVVAIQRQHTAFDLVKDIGSR